MTLLEEGFLGNPSLSFGKRSLKQLPLRCPGLEHEKEQKVNKEVELPCHLLRLSGSFLFPRMALFQLI